MTCIVKAAAGDENAQNRLVKAAGDILPSGEMNVPELRKRTGISQLLKSNQVSRPDMHKALYLLLKNFCESINVVRPMTEAQIREASFFLLDECGDYRIEDYIAMFSLGKRGKLVPILDRIDIQVIGAMKEEYEYFRRDAIVKERSEFAQHTRSRIWFNNMNLRGFLGWGVLLRAYEHNISKILQSAVLSMRQDISKGRAQEDKKRAEEIERYNAQVQEYAKRNDIDIEAIKNSWHETQG
jgi:hypothetical protein